MDRPEAPASGVETLHALLRDRASSTPDRPAILAPSRAGMTYRQLFAQANTIGRRIAETATDPSARIAVALPNGPEMAVACLGTAACRPCIPLNPDEPRAELLGNLASTGARAVVVAARGSEALTDAALELGLPIIVAEPDLSGPAGAMTLRPSVPVGACPAPMAAAASGRDDVALIFRTSGTTASPKVVRLSHRNVLSVAAQVAAQYSLGPEDRCLSVMPLSHSHALIFAMMSALHGGGSIVCAPAFHQEHFFAWIGEFQPTWYTAVPSIHQAVIANASSYRRHAPGHRFRFVASGSASLSPTTLARLEEVVGAPVIESYGLTETATVFTSNPMPPAVRKPGSVGLPIGSEVAILDAAGRVLPRGSTGEICACGPGVMLGYDDPAANEAAFAGAWFRTGDEGYLDPDGYLFITGRIKEMVNRGGRKISPREIDDALLEIPGVEQAGAFGYAHPSLGEDLAAAVVLGPGSTLDAAAIRAALAGRLADYKVPSRIVFVERLPRTASGKLQRTRLAEMLPPIPRRDRDAHGPDGTGSREAVAEGGPHHGLSEHERTVAEVWSALLGVDDLRPEDNFFDLGGHSLLVTQAIERIEQRTGVRLRPQQFSLETLGQLAVDVQSRAGWPVQARKGPAGVLRRLFGTRRS